MPFSLRSDLKAASRAILLGALWVAAPGFAADTVPAAFYPIQSPDADDRQSIARIEALLTDAFVRIERRGVLVARRPMFLDAACANRTTTACIASLAGKNGVIFFTDAREKPGGTHVTLWAIAGTGKRSRPVRFVLTPGIDDTRGPYDALALLEEQAKALVLNIAPPEVIASPVGAREAEAAAPARASTVPESRAPADAVSASPPLAAAPTAEVERFTRAPPPPNPWMRPVGIGASIGGVALVGGGIAFGLAGQGLSDELSRRYETNALRRTDRPLYGQVRTYAALANTMMIGGAIVAATGVTLWGMAPSVEPSPGGHGGRFSLRGRF